MENNNKGFPSDFLLVKQEMIEQFLAFNTRSASKAEVQNWFDKLIERIKAAGWRRRHVWEMLHNVYSIPNLQDEYIDIVGDYADNLVGFCSLANIDRFPGDPEDRKELSAYIASGKWKYE